MSKQTAVEWLVEQLEFDVLISNHDIKTVIEQALAMEREQIIQAWMTTDHELQRIVAEKYYERTYGKEAGHES